MCATNAQATALAIVASKSFASLRQRAMRNFEALRRVGTFDDFYRPFADALQSLAQFISGITTIGEDVAQPGIARADRSKDAWSAVAILNAGFMHDESDQISLGIGDDVALAALDFLACVKAPWATAFRGFHRLAVNHSGRRARLSTSRLARRHHESVVERGKNSTARPCIKITLYRRIRWEVLGHLDGVDDSIDGGIRWILGGRPVFPGRAALRLIRTARRATRIKPASLARPPATATYMSTVVSINSAFLFVHDLF
jgi:hypothetical protein